VVFRCLASTFLEADNEHLREEVFGPCVLLVHCESEKEMYRVSQALDGQLTASVFATDRYESQNTTF
jgi:NADP-dependent aldehyde dehydrogenase